jgi:hypothetical protein
VTWQRGIKVAGEIKIANQLTLNREVILNPPNEPTRVLKVGERSRRGTEGDVMTEKWSEKCNIVAFENGEKEILQAGKGKETILLPSQQKAVGLR